MVMCAAIAGACDNTASNAKSNPDRPAVVQAPPIILPHDTAKPDTMPDYRARMAAFELELMREYSVMGAAMIIGDRKMLASMLDPNATLQLDQTTHRGFAAVTAALVDFARTNALQDFGRASRVRNEAKGVVTDSGWYRVIGKRAGGEVRTDTGTYVAVWNRRDNPVAWTLVSDVLTPPKRRTR
ncbi:MAG: hypothetical protein FJ202_06825 [Gemmatimonadetes bacterium]|nr:hypothetical protein [Gemmatimonadota bacterium]